MPIGSLPLMPPGAAPPGAPQPGAVAPGYGAARPPGECLQPTVAVHRSEVLVNRCASFFRFYG